MSRDRRSYSGNREDRRESKGRSKLRERKSEDKVKCLVNHVIGNKQVMVLDIGAPLSLVGRE